MAIRTRSSSPWGVGVGTASIAGGPTSGGYFSHWQPPIPPPSPTLPAHHRSFASVLDPPPRDSPIPTLQLHASLIWPTSTLRLGLSTSLLINHPSPAFMSLPLHITATSLFLTAEIILALDGDNNRLHLSLLPIDDASLHPHLIPDAQAPSPQPVPATPHVQPTLGTRILPSMTFESSVGQADKQTLRNVGKVEKFVLDLVRKAVEDELVFPSFYTIDLNR